MADIEDRAKAWAQENLGDYDGPYCIEEMREQCIAAYLAGAAQAAADYSAFYLGRGQQ